MGSEYLLLIISTFCVVGLIRDTDGARILGIFPLDAKSHFNMFGEVMKALADAGHQVDVVSQHPLKKPYPNYTDISIASAGAAETKILTYDMIHSFSGSGSTVMLKYTGNLECQSLGRPQFQELIKNPPNDPPYDLYITESFYGSCWYAFGRHLGVPVVALSSTTIFPHANEPLGNPLNPAIVPDIDDGSTVHMNFWQRLRNTFNTLEKTWTFNYYSEKQSEIVKKYFGPEMPGVRELERDIALFLVNSHYTLSGIRPTTPAVVEVGGMHVRNDGEEIPAKLAKWLDESTNGFIYFTFGSMVKIESFPKATLVELLSGIEKISPIRVLMRVSAPEDLPSNIPENLATFKWLPQTKVFQHKNIRGFATHGGLFGILEALTFSVPLIGIPIFADQPVNIKNCIDRGVAVSLDYKDFTAGKFVSAVNDIIYDPKYKNNMDVLSKSFLDRPLNARDTAVFWIEFILRHGSDALRSPAVKLSWWQLALLDVYGSVIITGLIVVYLIKLILSALLRQILSVTTMTTTTTTTTTTSKKKNK